jgi:hypothetical protein
MTIQKRFQSDNFPGDAGFPVASDEEMCTNYEPGMLAQIEDELSAERDRVFEEEFFFGCAI